MRERGVLVQINSGPWKNIMIKTCKSIICIELAKLGSFKDWIDRMTLIKAVKK